MGGRELLAHWLLEDDCRDHAGESHGSAEGVTFATDEIVGRRRAVAVFDGLSSRITVPDSEALHLGSRDFTVSLWIKVDAPVRGAFGTLLSKFDGPQRCGLDLSIAGPTPGYTGASDARHVHLGIDDGLIEPWVDCGRPLPSNPNVPWVGAYDGALYCGMADADGPSGWARVFRWAGGQEWADCGRLGDDPNHHSSQSMVVHRGQLCVSAGFYDWETVEGYGKRRMPLSPARVYAYEGGTEWRDLGRVGNGLQVSALTSFEGDLYASLEWKTGGGHCFRYDGSRWHDCGVPGAGYLACLLPWRGDLYAATHAADVWRYEGGQEWTNVGRQPHGVQQIHSMLDVAGDLWIGTWPQGYVLRYEGGDQWAIIGTLGIRSTRKANEVMDLVAYNGKIYAALLPKAQVYRYEADNQWTLLASLASRPDWEIDDHYTWNRVTSLAVFQGRLFASTGSCVGQAGDVDAEETLGRVLSLRAGCVASHDRDIGHGWTHLAGVRRGKELRLYVNGHVSSVDTAPAGKSLNLTNLCDLTIGFGTSGFFRGRMADIRVYGEALDEEQVARAAR